jgi:hypothetical protein
MELTNQISELKLQKSENDHANSLAETKRMHDAQIAKMQADVEAASRRADIAEAKGGAKGSVTEQETSTPPGFFGRLFGAKPTVTKTITTTKTPLDTTAEIPKPKEKPDTGGIFTGAQPPPVNQRIVGKTKWKMPNGEVGTWDSKNGHMGWVVNAR